MKNQKNSIGLNQEKTKHLVGKLNDLLSNYQVFYQNLRGFHWNIKGDSFFELHAKFEELYIAANESVDEIAERILTLEGKPLHSFTDYLNQASIAPAKDVSGASETVEITISNLSTLIGLEREILSIADEVNDEGTNALMSDYIRVQEKTIWMLKAYNA
ncbi:MAG: DNA starvation/stationary phase protection protein [Salibacteraceae bacterium]